MSKHAKERGIQRYNIELSKEDQKTILGYINTNQYYPVCEPTRSKNRFVCYVRFKHVPLKVVYATNKYNFATSIITLLPLNVEEYNEIMNNFLESQNEKFDDNISLCIKFLKANGYIVYKRGEK